VPVIFGSSEHFELILVPQDGSEVSVDKDILKMVGMFAQEVEEAEKTEADREQPLSAPNVSGEVWDLIYEYLHRHRSQTGFSLDVFKIGYPGIAETREVQKAGRTYRERSGKPLASTDLVQCGVSEDDKNWIIGLSRENFFAVMNAANYLDIQHLSDLCAAHLATQIMGKSAEEITTTVAIRSDLANMEARRQIIASMNWGERPAN
jgi:hypothetical protein